MQHTHLHTHNHIFALAYSQQPYAKRMLNIAGHIVAVSSTADAISLLSNVRNPDLIRLTAGGFPLLRRRAIFCILSA